MPSEEGSGAVEDGVWVQTPDGFAIGTYSVHPESTLFRVNQIRFRYSYNRDTVALQGINDEGMIRRVSVGYIRMRDRISPQDYCTLVCSQIQQVASGEAVREAAIPEKKPEKTVANGTGEEKRNKKYLDVSDTPCAPNEPHISAECTVRNILTFKPSGITISFHCIRCGHMHTKALSPKAVEGALRANAVITESCENCRTHMRIDTLFHLTFASGYPPTALITSNLARFSTQRIRNTTVRSAAFNVVCRACSGVSVLAASTQRACECGALLEIRLGSTWVTKEETRDQDTKKKPLAKESDTHLGVLQNRGTCKHYKKSTRIFVFPCCRGKYPCDICHDEAEAHKAEWAQRMICGVCGVESTVSEQCKNLNCKNKVTGKHTSHWEGGKGSRDKTTMSKKDKKKYKN